jgi:tRNA A-37 threonylcarbamoyl transferase component Bud32
VQPITLGKYQLLKRIAAGGMAEIFVAKVTGLPGFDKIVVIKRILPQLATNNEFIQMFLDEARIAATLQHPNIVQMYDIGAVDGNYFISMEYLFGEDLRTLLKALKAQHRWIPIEHALSVVIGMCAGLHYAHEKAGFDGKKLGIVHRDVTPQNVFVTFDGSVKIVDFGIAKATNRFGETRYGGLKGKIPYMSPEQCKSEPLDRRSDVYSIGIMLYELTTATRLYKGASEFEVLKKIVEDRVTPPSLLRPGYDKDLEAIVLKALAKKREERYQSARELQADLEAFAREHKLTVSPIALSGFMEEVFPGKVEAWHDAQAHGKDLATHIAERAEESQSGAGAGSGPSGSGGAAADDDFDAAGMLAPSPPGHTPTAAGQVLGGAPRAIDELPPARSASKRWLIGGALVAAVAAAAVAFAVLRKSPPAEPSTQAVAAPAGADAGAVALAELQPPDAAPAVEVALAPPDAGAPGVAGPTGKLSVTSKPNGVLVSVDGVERGKAPLELELPTGDHEITGELAGHGTDRERVKIKARKTTRVRLRLEKRGGEVVVKKPDKPDKPDKPPPDPAANAPGELRVATTPSCEVIIDGKARGSTPVRGIMLAPGNHTVQLVSSRFGIDRTFTVEVKSGEVTKKKWDFPVENK